MLPAGVRPRSWAYNIHPCTAVSPVCLKGPDRSTAHFKLKLTESVGRAPIAFSGLWRSTYLSKGTWTKAKAQQGPQELPDHFSRWTKCALHSSTQASPLGICWFRCADPVSLSRHIKGWSAPSSANPCSWGKNFTKEKCQNSLKVIFKLIAPDEWLTLCPSLALPPTAPGGAAGDPFLLSERALVKVGEMRIGVVTLPAARVIYIPKSSICWKQSCALLSLLC